MKKIFTLAAMVSMAWGVNAQTPESWYVNNEDGTLKADYVANTDASKMSEVKFATANVDGVHTSGPVAGYTDDYTTPLQPKVDNTWGDIKKQDMSKDGSVAPFYYVQGKGNPVNIEKVTWEEVMTDGEPTGMYRAKWDDSYYAPDGSNGLPSNGTYVALTPKTDGTLKVAMWTNKGNRDVYVVKGSDAKALAFGTDVKVSGYVQATNNDVPEDSPLFGYMLYQEDIPTKGTEGSDAFVIGAGNRPVWVWLTFSAKANETYYVFNKNTQIGFGGFEFTSTGGSAAIDDILSEDNAPVEYFNLQGIRVANPENGLYIRRQGKNVSKVIL